MNKPTSVPQSLRYPVIGLTRRQTGMPGTRTAGSILAPTDPPLPRATEHAPPQLEALSLLKVPEVAHRLQVSERQVRRWIADARLPAVRLGRAVRVRPDDLAQFISAGLTS
jgi:excisionase family DNA binding protein